MAHYASVRIEAIGPSDEVARLTRESVRKPEPGSPPHRMNVWTALAVGLDTPVEDLVEESVNFPQLLFVMQAHPSDGRRWQSPLPPAVTLE